MFDPADFTHPYTRTGTFLINTTGVADPHTHVAAAVARAESEQHALRTAALDAGRAVARTITDALDRDRDSRVPSDLDADTHPAGAHADRNRPYDAPARRPRSDRVE